MGITSEYYCWLITWLSKCWIESRWEKPDDVIPHSGNLTSGKVKEKFICTLKESKTSDSHSDSDKELEAEKKELPTKTQKLQIRFKEKSKISSKAIEPEKKKNKNIQEQNSSVPKEKPKTPKKVTPYGEWQEIKQEVESQEDIDLELPSTENEYVATSEADDGEEPKVVFKEKTVTSLGAVADGVAPVFKKRRIENGKSRNLRQRGDDQ